MKSILLSCVAILLAGCASVSSCEKENFRTLFFAGDSTLQSRRFTNIVREDCLGSWGDALQYDLREGVRLDNYALSGYSTKSFIDNGAWDKLLAKVKRGDYVIIQFGHNDQKKKDPKRYAPAQGAYRDNLTRFAREVRAKGATPVFVTSMARRFFTKDGRIADGLEDYPETVRKLGRELNVDVVDMNASTRALLEKTPHEVSLPWYRGKLYENDMTHPTQEGARVISRLFLEEVKSRQLPISELFR